MKHFDGLRVLRLVHVQAKETQEHVRGEGDAQRVAGFHQGVPAGLEITGRAGRGQEVESAKELGIENVRNNGYL